MATYTPSLQSNLGCLSALLLIKPHSLEESVQVLWQGIVSEWFPFRDGHRYSIKGFAPTNNTMPYVAVIEVMTIIPNPENSADFDERQTLLVECKRPSRDTPLEWHEGQFEDDLTENLNASGRLFGAVAIGKKVRFYQFNGKAPAGQKVAQLHRDTIDMSTDSGIIEVERMMNYVKANAWQ